MEEWNLVYNELVSIGDDEKVLEMDGGNGCTTMRTHLPPMNCTLENDENGEFYVVCILPKETTKKKYMYFLYINL